MVAPHRLEVFNEFFFRDLSRYGMRWELLRNGEKEAEGEVDDVNVAPQGRRQVHVPYGDIDGSAEWLLNLSYYLKEADGLLAKDFVVAREQIAVDARPSIILPVYVSLRNQFYEVVISDGR